MILRVLIAPQVLENGDTKWLGYDITDYLFSTRLTYVGNTAYVRQGFA